MRTVFMVKIDSKIRVYKSTEYALAVADARDYDSKLEEYVVLSNRTFKKVK